MKRNLRKVDFLDKARIAWGKALPDWVAELAREANRTKAADAAKRVGYSGAVLSHVFANNYGGDIRRVEEKVRGALMGMTVDCPVVGEIGRGRCLDEQKMPNTGASSVRSAFYRHCRGIGVPRCIHSRHGGDDAQ